MAANYPYDTDSVAHMTLSKAREMGVDMRALKGTIRENAESRLSQVRRLKKWS